jgi:hypothetical protein
MQCGRRQGAGSAESVRVGGDRAMEWRQQQVLVGVSQQVGKG